MPAGTLTLTNNSAVVKGAGTAFNTELKAGDFIVSVVGGVTYTLPVKTMDSATQVTLIKAYDGPTQAGAAWYAVPRDAMNTITAQLASETAKALRGLNLDKNNWQQVFSGTGNITVTLPDGSTYTGPAWNSFTSSLNNKANKGANRDITSLSGLTTALSMEQGGTGATNAKDARWTLGLGSAATANIGANKDEVMIGGEWGLGGSYKGYKQVDTRNINDILPQVSERGIIALRNNSPISDNGPDWNTPAWGPSIWCRTEDVYAIFNMASTENHLSVSCGSLRTGWGINKVIWHSRNTTVDGNGFIKKASPVTSIFRDGTYSNNEEAENVTCKRLDVGVYYVDGCLGFYHDNGWKFEVPKDENGNQLIWVDYKVSKDGSIIFKTYHRTNDCPIPELQNNVDGYKNGDSIDIPEGKFLMVRLNVPNSQYPEYVPDNTIPPIEEQ
ncbi:phage tail fiber protein [Serratia liquefaciens]|uniref:phage tail fiber protein n=1 Tax=Serratia liquefaciens TaxID=614 RepID=UPI0037FBA005